MMPVEPQPEPDVFDRLVRIPGKNFLKQLSSAKPTDKEWNRHAYWKSIRPQLKKCYNCVCAYYAHWIPPGSSYATVDHYIPKSVEPRLAYEWSNFRLACEIANQRKREFQDVLDPFQIEDNWFILDFPSLLLKPHPDLPANIQEQVWATINRLRLNDDQTLVEERSHWIKQYCLGAGFRFLKVNAPFIAYELMRQNLEEDIKNMMVFEQEREDY